MNPSPFLLVLLIVFITSANGCKCHASFFHFPRKLTGQALKQMSPEDSPSPSPAPSMWNHVGSGVTDERCRGSSGRSCHVDRVTACVVYSRAASKDSFLLVQNDGEDLLEVNVKIVDVKVTWPLIKISKHQAKKISISEIVGGSPSIILNAGKGPCVIHLGSQDPGGKLNKQFSAYAITNLTPKYGVYLLFLTAVIVGVAWACCKLVKSERQVNGIPYQELEMGQPDSCSANNVETAEGWDEGWDDEWGEIKEVKSPNGNKTGDVLANGHTSSTSDKDGWGNTWQD